MGDPEQRDRCGEAAGPVPLIIALPIGRLTWSGALRQSDRQPGKIPADISGDFRFDADMPRTWENL